MGLSNKKKAFTATLVNVSRLLLAVVLIFSGFVKAVDPMGLAYKLQDYAAAFGLDTIGEDWMLFAALLLSASEFIMGVFLLTGVYRRVTTLFTFLFFLFFTPFTLLLAVWNPVQDCGCFGDAIKLSNWGTFAKNLLLFVMATLAWVKRRMYVRRISNGNRWMVALFSICYIALVEWFALAHLPIMDFRPFAIGTNLRVATEDIPSVTRTIYKFEKDGTVAEFNDDNYPDSTWNYLGSRIEVLEQGKTALVPDFSFVDIVTGEDYGDAILSDTGFVCILVVNRIERADESRGDKINDLYDYCRLKGYGFYAATSSAEDEIEQWRKRTGAEYPFLWADDVMLKTMVRSNPGALLIKDARVMGKWNAVDIPDIEVLMESPGFVPHNIQGIYRYARGWRLCTLLFIVPLLLIMVIDVATSRKAKSTVSAGNVKPDEAPLKTDTTN